MITSLYRGLDTIRNVLIVNDKVGRGVALIGPHGCTEFGPAYSLTPRDGARGGNPAAGVTTRDLPGDSPGTLPEGGIRWVTSSSITPQGVRETTKRGGPIVTARGGRVARQEKATCRGWGKPAEEAYGVNTRNRHT